MDAENGGLIEELIDEDEINFGDETLDILSVKVGLLTAMEILIE